MKKNAALLTLFTLFSFNTFAADYTQWGLPEGTKARLGKGGLSGDIAYSPDGTRLAVCSSIGIWLYDTATFHAENSRNGEVALLTGHTEMVHNVAFSPDGNTIASGSYDNTVRFWDAHTGTLIHTLHTGGIRGLSFSPDGNTIATGGGSVRLWNAHTGKLIRTLTEHTDIVLDVAFSPHGNTIATGSNDGTVLLWNAHTGTLIHTLTGHMEKVSSVAFSPDGNTVASGSLDETVRLWDAHTGTLIRTLTKSRPYKFADWVLSVAFSPDGNTDC